jgi:hypothetical protein
MNEHIYQNEENILQDAKKLALSDQTDLVNLQQEYKSLTKAYDELLGNIIVMTNISDRFQEKFKLANDKLQQQAELITSINIKLTSDNRSLKADLNTLNKQRAIAELLETENFNKKFPDKEACYKFFNELKWADEYVCRKCGNKKYCDGNSPLARRCTKCRYDESVTAFTIFHKCKFSITKAIYMLLLIHYQQGNISSYELSRQLELRQKTCWSFKQKVMAAIDKLSDTDRKDPESWMKLIFNP